MTVSFLLAVPVTWWAMNSWLQDFAYRIRISSWIFVAAGACSLLVAMATISFQAIKIAIANPAKSLRMD